jgi:hypothetical protein
MKNAYRILVDNPEEMRPHRIIESRWKVNFEE